MELSGFNHKLHILLKSTIKKLLTFKIDPLRFKIMKDEVNYTKLNKFFKYLVFLYQFKDNQ